MEFYTAINAMKFCRCNNKDLAGIMLSEIIHIKCGMISLYVVSKSKTN